MQAEMAAEGLEPEPVPSVVTPCHQTKPMSKANHSYKDKMKVETEDYQRRRFHSRSRSLVAPFPGGPVPGPGDAVSRVRFRLGDPGGGDGAAG